ncbi:hypothetical protein [Streptosporangium sp. NPDC087985]|uniref:hypothetical protein n=1 Tax=Streptosporangium sp. NPDC087985 TaxID=3366196 RepID=UPI00382D6A18
MKNDVVADLEWVAEYWPDLIESRIPGTRRPWRQTDLTPAAIAARDAQARLERFERSMLSLGASPAPVDVAILSSMLDLLVQADDLAAAVAHVAGDSPLPPPGPGELDARPYLLYAARRLPDDLVEHAAPIAHRMVEQVARALCMVYDGQHLAVTCPWCGADDVWRVRELPGGMVAIVCEGVCDPPPKEVGTWWHGQPVWPISDWERLARRIRAAEERAA